MTILLTAFTPWDTIRSNPSRAIAHALEGRYIRSHLIVSAVLPVDFHQAPLMIEPLLARHRPAIVLSIGLAASRGELNLERFARNRARERSPEGGEPLIRPLIPGAPEVLEAPYPIERAADGLKARGFPARVSEDAGDFVCNALFYRLLLWRSSAPDAPRVGFLHIPWLEESPKQDRLAGQGTPGRALPRALVVAGVRWLLEFM